MRILSHYFAARYLGLFATVLVTAFLVLATIELVFNLDDLSTFGSDPLASTRVFDPLLALRYLWVRLASYYLADLLPIASFIAAFITFAWAGRTVELIAVQAGGIRISRIVFPVLGTALILSLAAAVLHETLVLRAKQIWSVETGGNRDDLTFGREAFWHKNGRSFTNIRFADPDTRTLHGVEIFERGENGTIRRVIRADLVQITKKGIWQLDDATIWTFDPLDPAASPSLEEHVSIALDPDSTSGDSLLSADPGGLALAKLSDYLARHPTDDSSNSRRLREQFEDRRSSPWLILVFAWFALPFGLRVDERGRVGGPATAAIAALGVFFLLKSAGTTLSRQGLIPAGATPWFMIAIVVIGTALALRRRAF